MSTIRDVARFANVSPITVSRVMNNSGAVKPVTRMRVEEAIQKLGYIPNDLARSFRRNQTGIIALILTDVTNPFWTTVARGVEDIASREGLHVVLCNSDESDEKLTTYLRTLLEKRVDGLLLVPVQDNPEPFDLIARQSTPVVVLDRRLGANHTVDVVRCDSSGGAQDLTRLLLERGHRRIALLNGPVGVSTAEDRLTGYRAAMQQAAAPEAVLSGDFSIESGFALAEQALQLSPRPTAWVAANNFIAIGALKALRQHAISVPRELSIVAFDDLPERMVIDPFLTVVAQPAESMGRCAAERLIARMRGDTSPAHEIVLPTHLVERNSVRDLNVS